MMRVNYSTKHFMMFTPGHICTDNSNENSIQSASFKKCFAVLEVHGNSLYKYLNLLADKQKAFRSYLKKKILWKW